MVCHPKICLVLRATFQAITVLYGMQVMTEEFRPNQPPRETYSTVSVTQGLPSVGIMPPKRL